MRISPIPHIDGTLWYARADVEAAIAERDAEIERLREEVHHHSSTRAVLERHLAQVDSGYPTLAEVAMHIMAARLANPDIHASDEAHAKLAIMRAEALLAELKRREG